MKFKSKILIVLSMALGAAPLYADDQTQMRKLEKALNKPLRDWTAAENAEFGDADALNAFLKKYEKTDPAKAKEAKSRMEVRRKEAGLEETLGTTQQEVKQLTQKLAQTEEQAASLQKDLDMMTAQYRDADRQWRDWSNRAKQAEEQLKTQEENIETARKKLETMMDSYTREKATKEQVQNALNALEEQFNKRMAEAAQYETDTKNYIKDVEDKSKIMADRVVKLKQKIAIQKIQIQSQQIGQEVQRKQEEIVRAQNELDQLQRQENESNQKNAQQIATRQETVQREQKISTAEQLKLDKAREQLRRLPASKAKKGRPSSIVISQQPQPQAGAASSPKSSLTISPLTPGPSAYEAPISPRSQSASELSSPQPGSPMRAISSEPESEKDEPARILTTPPSSPKAQQLSIVIPEQQPEAGAGGDNPSASALSSPTSLLSLSSAPSSPRSASSSVPASPKSEAAAGQKPPSSIVISEQQPQAVAGKLPESHYKEQKIGAKTTSSTSSQQQQQERSGEKPKRISKELGAELKSMLQGTSTKNPPAPVSLMIAPGSSASSTSQGGLSGGQQQANFQDLIVKAQNLVDADTKYKNKNPQDWIKWATESLEVVSGAMQKMDPQSEPYKELWKVYQPAQTALATCQQEKCEEQERQNLNDTITNMLNTSIKLSRQL